MIYQQVKKVKIEKVDRISSLPDDLIHHILSFLEVRFSVRTSVLSKRFHLIWITLPFLKFEGTACRLTTRRSIVLKTLNLTCCTVPVKNWGFPILSTLHLEDVVYPENIADFFSGLVSLQNLTLSFREKSMQNLSISCPQLINLQITTCFTASSKFSGSFEVLAPNLCNFTSVGIFPIKLGDPKLEIVNIRLRGVLDEISIGRWKLHRYYRGFRSMFSGLGGAKILTLDSETIQGRESHIIASREVYAKSINFLSSINQLEAHNRFHLICITLPSLKFDGAAYNLTTRRSIVLKTFSLTRCTFPKRDWVFPILSTLELEDVVYPENIGDFFSALVSLENLTKSFHEKSMQNLSISCPQLINLQINTCFSASTKFSGSFVVLAPKLCNFTSVGIFPIKLGDPKLENVNIKLRGWLDEISIGRWKLHQYFRGFRSMFSGLGSAKILTLDSETIQALSAISDFLIQYPSPFYNLKYVKLPQRHTESSISGTLRSYLLGGSPVSKIVTKLPQDNMITGMAPLSVMAQNVTAQNVGSQSKELFKSLDIRKKVCADVVGMGVQQDHVVGNSVADVSTFAGIYGEGDSVVQGFGVLVPRAPLAGADNDEASSFGGNNDLGLWQGHEVNCEFVSLLDRIMEKYPETFEHFATKSKKFCTMKLNMLCTSVKDFTKTSMTRVNTETITEYKALFAELQKLGFNVNWLISHLDYIDQLRFSQPILQELYAIDSRLQDLQTLRAQKMAEIEKAFGAKGSNLVVGSIGDLLSAP